MNATLEQTHSTRIVPRTRDLVEEVRSLVGALVRGWRLIALAVVACLTVATLSLVATKRVYQARARLLVLQQGGRPLNVTNTDSGRSVEGPEDYIPTHAMIVRSPVVIGRALESIGFKGLPSLARAEDPTQEAIARLSVSRPDRTAKVIQIDYQAGSREEATRVVGAVAESYRTFLEASYQKNNGEVVTLITRAREGLRAELERMEVKYLEFRRDHPVMTADESGRSFVARRLEQWDRSANEAMVKAVQIQSQLELGRDLEARGTSLWAIACAMNQLGGVPADGQVSLGAAVPQSDYLRQLAQEQQQLSERFGPQYSKVRDLQDQIDRVQDRARDAKGRLDRADARDLLGAIERSLKGIETMRAGYVAKFDEDLSRAKAIEIDRLTEANLKGALERHRALFNTVVDQLKQAQLAGDYGSISAQTIEPPNALRNPVRPQVALTLMLALLAGCALGSGAAVVADRLDQRIRTPEELRQALEVSLLGLIPQLPADEAAASGAVGRISHALPRSPLAEAYKAARTNLEAIRRNRLAQVVLITSPQAGDGKSTTASNLAISVSQAGRRVLLIDADLRRPAQDRIHNLRRDRGLVHLLSAPLPLADSVQSSQITGLDLITAGPVPPNPAELLMSPRLGEILDEARRTYDLVLIDSSPLLAVTDPAVLGALVDGVLLVVRMSTTRHYDARRAVSILKAVGTPVLGTILNGVVRDRGTYGYGYGYGYGTHGTYGDDHRGTETPGPLEPVGNRLAQTNGVHGGTLA